VIGVDDGAAFIAAEVVDSEDSNDEIEDPEPDFTWSSKIMFAQRTSQIFQSR